MKDRNCATTDASSFKGVVRLALYPDLWDRTHRLEQKILCGSCTAAQLHSSQLYPKLLKDRSFLPILFKLLEHYLAHSKYLTKRLLLNINSFWGWAGRGLSVAENRKTGPYRLDVLCFENSKWQTLGRATLIPAVGVI